MCTSLNEASSALFRTDGNIRSAQRKSISAKGAALPVTFHYTGTEKSTCPVTFQRVNYLELDHQIFAALLLKDFSIHNFDLSCQVLAINFFYYLSNFSTNATLSPILQAITVLLKIGSLRLKWVPGILWLEWHHSSYSHSRGAGFTWNLRKITYFPLCHYSHIWLIKAGNFFLLTYTSRAGFRKIVFLVRVISHSWKLFPSICIARDPH